MLRDDYYDLGGFGRPVTTASDDAQTWFDRGLTWCYAFNHEEAVRCFQHAIAADPACAMAHWGLAYADRPQLQQGLGGLRAAGADRRRGHRSRRRHPRQRAGRRRHAGRAGADRSAAGALPEGHAGRGLRSLERRVRGRHAQGLRRVRRRPRRCLAVRRGADRPHALAALGPADRRARRRAPTRPRRWRCSSAAMAGSNGDAPTPACCTCTSTRWRCRPSRSGRCGPPTSCATSSPTPATSCTCPPTSTCSAATTATWSPATAARSWPTASSWSAKAPSTSTPSTAATTTTSRSTARCSWASRSRRWRRPPSCRRR